VIALYSARTDTAIVADAVTHLKRAQVDRTKAAESVF
jgi:hypothetical protein